MTTKQLTGSYPNGFYLGPQYSALRVGASATVGGNGITTSAQVAPTITNLGSIAGTALGIRLRDGGTIINGSPGDTSASINGVTAILATGGATRIVNRGDIDSDAVTTTTSGNTYISRGASVELLSGGTVLNEHGIGNGISISGSVGYIVNQGGIGGVYDRVSYGTGGSSTTYGPSITLSAGGTVENGKAQTSATIENGISIAGGVGKVVNFGAIGGPTSYAYQDREYPSGGTSYSITMSAGGRVTNGTASDTSAAVQDGISIKGGTGTVANFGTIGAANSFSTYYTRLYGVVEKGGKGFAIETAGGTIVNGSANVTGAVIGGSVLVGGGVGHVVNFGTIYGSRESGAYYASETPAIDLKSGGTIVNGSASSHSALVDGGVYADGRVTVTNFGTIEAASVGHRIAIDFGASTDHLIEEGSGTLDGTVIGGGGTLILGGAAGAGSIGGIGSEITGFRFIIVDPGSAWNITGDTTIEAGSIFQIRGAAIGVTGALTNRGLINDISGIGLGADGTIENDGVIVLDGNDGDGGIGGLGKRTDVALVNNGQITDYGYGTLHVSTINNGKIEVYGGGLDITGRAFENDGLVIVSGGTIDIASRVSGTGALVLRSGTLALDVAPSSTQSITFQGDTAATLALGASGSYANTIKGFAAGDTLDLRSLQGGTASFSEAAGAKYGILTVSDGTDTTRLKLYGTYTAADFATTADAGGTGTDVTYTGPAPQGAHAEFVQALFDGAFGPAPFAAGSAHDPFAPGPTHETLAIAAGKA